jgi:hypothetical protein
MPHSLPLRVKLRSPERLHPTLAVFAFIGIADQRAIGQTRASGISEFFVLLQATVFVGVAVLIVVLGRLAYQWNKFHAKRLVTCPENRRPAGVDLDAWRAAWTGWGKAPEFRLGACTRWPERAGCGQQCLSQIEAAPQDCEVRRILARWYEGKKCASCGLPFGEILWEIRKPALLTADRKTVEWTQVPVDQLPEVLERSTPICFACHMASTLVREHPELSVERPEAQTPGRQGSSKT